MIRSITIVGALLLLNSCITGIKVTCTAYSQSEGKDVQTDYEYCVFYSIGDPGKFNQCMKSHGWTEHRYSGSACQSPPNGQIPRPVHMYGK